MKEKNRPNQEGPSYLFILVWTLLALAYIVVGILCDFLQRCWRGLVYQPIKFVWVGIVDAATKEYEEVENDLADSRFLFLRSRKRFRIFRLLCALSIVCFFACGIFSFWPEHKISAILSGVLCFIGLALTKSATDRLRNV